MSDGRRYYIEFPGRTMGAVLEHMLHYPVLERVPSDKYHMLIKAIHPGITHEFAFVGEHTYERETVEKILSAYFLAKEAEKEEDREVDPVLMATVIRRILDKKGCRVALPPPTERTYQWFVHTYCDLLEHYELGSHTSYTAQLQRCQHYFQRVWAR